MILNIQNIESFSDDTLKNIIATCYEEMNKRKTKLKKEKIKQICILLHEINEIDYCGTGWYDMGNDTEYSWYDFMKEFADYHNVPLDFDNKFENAPFKK